MANVRVIEEFINLLGDAFEPELQGRTLSVLAGSQTDFAGRFHWSLVQGASP